MMHRSFNRNYDTHGYTGTYGSHTGGGWVGSVRGANMHTGSTHSPMHTYRPYLLHNGGPGMVRAGEEWKGMGSALASGAAGTAMRMRANANAQQGGEEEEPAAAPTPGIGMVATQPGPAPLAAGFRPSFGPSVDSLDANRPPSPQERMNLPGRLEQFSQSRVGKFMEGRAEKYVDRRLGAGTYAAETGRR